VVTSPSSPAQTGKPVVIKMSQMAHLAVGFFTLGLLVPVLNWPWTTPLLVLPIVLSAAIIRWRTVADRDTVTARGLLGSTTVRWEQIDGLKFVKSAWARARLTDGTEMRLPAVTFATLPLLTEASGGRVPNPYS
jgi:Bacterial PH domain